MGLSDIKITTTSNKVIASWEQLSCVDYYIMNLRRVENPINTITDASSTSGTEYSLVFENSLTHLSHSSTVEARKEKKKKFYL